MTKTKTILLIFIMLLIFLLSSCINTGEPIYVESITVYAGDELITGNYMYYDGNNWQDYGGKSTKEKIYYSVNVKKEDIKVIFNIYAPNTTLTKVKLVTNTNLFYANNNTVFIGDNIENIDGIYSCPFEFDFTNEFNAISVSGFATSNGLKYMGAKNPESNFVLYGVHLNLVD